MKSNERTAKYFDCMVEAYATNRGAASNPLPPKSMKEILQHLKARMVSAPYHRTNRSRTETWNIADIAFDAAGTKAILLINRSDRLAADQAISDPVAGEFIVTEKEDNQGNASSAHLAIQLTAVKPATYLAVLEEATGISTKDIEQILAQMLREARRDDRRFFMTNDVSGDPDLAKAARYRFTFVGHPSEDFQAELAAGTIHGIELSDFQAQDQAFDEQGFTVEKKKIIELAVKNTGSSIANFLNAVCRTADQQHFSSIRVKFTDSSDYFRTVEVDARTKRLVNEERFVKKSRLTEFTSKLNTGYLAAHHEIREKLFALI